MAFVVRVLRLAVVGCRMLVIGAVGSRVMSVQDRRFFIGEGHRTMVTIGVSRILRAEAAPQPDRARITCRVGRCVEQRVASCENLVRIPASAQRRSAPRSVTVTTSGSTS